MLFRSRWTTLRWADLLCGSFGGNSGAQAREASSTRPILWGFSLSLAGKLPLDTHRRWCLGVHERVGEGNPDDTFNGQRSDFGLTGGRPARSGEVLRFSPKDFGLRVLRD